jgi:hypothetical protein
VPLATLYLTTLPSRSRSASIAVPLMLTIWFAPHFCRRHATQSDQTYASSYEGRHLDSRSHRH